LRQLKIGRDYDLDAALALEYRLTQHIMAGHDLYEGIRAMLIDRDRGPFAPNPDLGYNPTMRCVRAPLSAVRRRRQSARQA
jgi:hypothetical protein